MTLINTVQVDCPYCGEAIELVVDYSSGAQEYVEDCSVCCRPMAVRVEQNRNKQYSVYVRAENE